jgi:hypothetical protein
MLAAALQTVVRSMPSSSPHRSSGAAMGRLGDVASGQFMAGWSHDSGLASDHQGQLVERDRHAPGSQLLDRQLVVSSPDVLHEGVPGDDYPGAVVLLEPAHRTQPRLQTAVVGLDVVVGIPIGAMPGR